MKLELIKTDNDKLFVAPSRERELKLVELKQVQLQRVAPSRERELKHDDNYGVELEQCRSFTGA